MSSIMVVIIFVIIIISVYVVSEIMFLIKLVLSDCNLVYFASIKPNSLTRRAIIDIRIISSNFSHWCRTVNAVDGNKRHHRTSTIRTQSHLRHLHRLHQSQKAPWRQYLLLRRQYHCYYYRQMMIEYSMLHLVHQHLMYLPP